MTTAQQPWTMELIPQSTGAKLKDATGNMIALFPDARNAEVVITTMIANAQTGETIAELEDEIDNLKEELKDQDKIIEKIRSLLSYKSDGELPNIIEKISILTQ